MPARPSSNSEQFIQGAQALPVPDVVATAEYYRDVLEFTRDFGDEAYAVVWRDNSAIHLVNDDISALGVHLFQWVRDADPYHEEVVSRGADVTLEPTDRSYRIREFAIQDINSIGIVFGQGIGPADGASEPA